MLGYSPIASFLVLSSLVLLSGYVVFRVVVRSEYEGNERLSAFAGALEFLVFALHANLSYTFLPAEWPHIPPLPEIEFHTAAGFAILSAGLVLVTEVGSLPDRDVGNRGDVGEDARLNGLTGQGIIASPPVCLHPATVCGGGACSHLNIIRILPEREESGRERDCHRPPC